MNINQPNQPRKDDAVLGDKNSLPRNAGVLGGIQGVKNRFNSAHPIEVKIAALKDALNYGDEGLDIIINAWRENPLMEIKFASYQLLKERKEPQIKKLLIDAPNIFDYDVITVNNKGLEISRKKHFAYCFKEDIGNGVTLDMVYIRGGTFGMGSPITEAESNDNEKPQHQVTIQPFCMGKYAATQTQWKAVAKLPKIKRDLEPDPSCFKGDNLPVENVSWYDSLEFCARLSQKTGRNYRLPSEAEWEYACRAGTITPFHFGETITTDLANYNGNDTYAIAPIGKYREKTTEVGSFPPNAFGLYDMHGNVFEWCADPWHGNYQEAPTDGTVWDEENNDNCYQNPVNFLVNRGNDRRARLLRGGSWLNAPRRCRLALRLNSAPDTRFSLFGFRVVCGAPWT